MRIALRSRTTKAGTTTLYLDYYDRGRRWLEYLKLYLSGDQESDRQTMRLAETVLAQRQREAVDREAGLSAPERTGVDFLEYCRKLREAKPSPSTRGVWRNALMHLEAFTGKKRMSFGTLDEWFLMEFRDYLLRRVSANTAAAYLARIKSACREAANQRIVRRYVGAGISIKRQKVRRDYLTLEELRALEGTPCPNTAVRDGFLFACFAGLGFGDVKALTWDQVRTEGKQTVLQLSRVPTGGSGLLPLSEQAAVILGAQRGARPSPRVKVAVAAGAVFKLPAQQTVDKALKRWAKRAGITKKVSFQVGRHTFATLGLDHGVDVHVMSGLLGHRRVETTEIYAKLMDESKRDAVRLLPKLKPGEEGK